MKPLVIVPVGLPGSGKTMLVESLASILEGHIVSRDAIRSAMFPHVEYTDLEKGAAFSAVLLAVEANIALGRTTLIDGIAFSSQEDFARAMAVGDGAIALPILCDCPVDVARRRVDADYASGSHVAADRTGDLVDQVAARFWNVPTSVPRLDMTKAPDDVVADALVLIEESRGVSR